VDTTRLNGPVAPGAVAELLQARAADAAAAPLAPADVTRAMSELYGALQAGADGGSTLQHLAAQQPAQAQWQAAWQAGLDAGAIRPPALPADAALAQAAQGGAPAAQLEVPGAALPTTAPPQAGAPVPDAVALPVLVGTLQAQPMQWRPVQRRDDDTPPPQRERRALWPQDDEDAHALPASPDGEDDAPAAHAAGDDAADRNADDACRLFRVLTRWLQSLPGHDALVAELAQRRRVLLVAPFERLSAPAGALQVFLLGPHARGPGAAFAYRGRGAAAWQADGATAPALRQWRVHREGAGDARARLVATRSIALAREAMATPMLSIRLAAAALPPPLRDMHDAWLDVIDAQRLLRDLGTQWSVLVAWSAQAVPGLRSE
jgi:hypothetical protein